MWTYKIGVAIKITIRKKTAIRTLFLLNLIKIKSNRSIVVPANAKIPVIDLMSNKKPIIQIRKEYSTTLLNLEAKTLFPESRK